MLGPGDPAATSKAPAKRRSAESVTTRARRCTVVVTELAMIALLMRLMMQLLEFGGGRLLVAREDDARMQYDFGHRHLAFGILGHCALGAVDIGIDDKAFARREIEERQHVAARQAGGEGLFRIDRSGSDIGGGTTCGDELPFTFMPPSNAH